MHEKQSQNITHQHWIICEAPSKTWAREKLVLLVHNHYVLTCLLLFQKLYISSVYESFLERYLYRILLHHVFQK
jgi:hypothetical protein